MQDELLFNRPLVEKYDRPGPRYTSYPTAPQFHAAFAEDDYRAAAERSNRVASPKPLSVYVHIPFCKSLCYYCACNKIITHNTERAAEYLSWLKQEIGVQGALFDETRRMTQLHLGGGTPTYLGNTQLGELMAALDEAFHFAPVEEREFSLEVDPRTVTPAQIHELHDLGFNRLSFGVQDFDTNVQKAVNRLQSEEQVVELVAAAREAGFQSVSVDLIYGLPLQTVASFDATLDKIIALRPDRIASYSYAHLPELFKAQRLIRPEDMPPPERKLELLELTIRRLTAAGYVYIGMDHFALPDDELTLARENGTLQRNFQGYSSHAQCDLIGLGMSSISCIDDVYAQNHTGLDAYERALDASHLPTARGIRLSFDDRVRRHAIERLMCDMELDFDELSEAFGIDAPSYLADALTRLEMPQRDGLLRKEGSRVIATPLGRLLIRHLAMAFDTHLPAQPDTLFSRIV